MNIQNENISFFIWPFPFHPELRIVLALRTSHIARGKRAIGLGLVRHARDNMGKLTVDVRILNGNIFHVDIGRKPAVNY